MFSFFRQKSQPVLPITAPTWGNDASGYDDVDLRGPASAHLNQSSFSLPNTSVGTFVGGTPSPSYPPTSRIAPTNGYPPIYQTFTRLYAFLEENSPSLYDCLAPPLLPQAPLLTVLLHDISPYHIPPAVIESYLLHDGQDPFASHGGLFFGLTWMPLEQVLSEWSVWRKFEQGGGAQGLVDAFSTRIKNVESVNDQTQIQPFAADDAEGGFHGMSTFPKGWVRSRYSHPGWLPLLTDGAGNYIGVDLDPPPPSRHLEENEEGQESSYGQAGQVIAFGREIDEKVVLFSGDSAGGWGRFLSSFVDDLERGQFSRLTESIARAKRASWTVDENPADSSSDDDQYDGLGEQDYITGGLAGETGNGDNISTWKLRSKWRHYLDDREGYGGVVGALAERSRQQWLNVGVGVATPPTKPTAMFEAKKLTIVVPENPEAGPASAETEKASKTMSPKIILRNGTDVGVELTSPKSPNSRPASVSSSKSNGSKGKTQRLSIKRPPPPAPVSLNLPTIFDIDGGEQNGYNGSYSNVTDDFPERSSFGEINTPTRAGFLENSSVNGSSIALVHDNQSVAALTSDGADFPLERVVIEGRSNDVASHSLSSMHNELDSRPRGQPLPIPAN